MTTPVSLAMTYVVQSLHIAEALRMPIERLEMPSSLIVAMAYESSDSLGAQVQEFTRRGSRVEMIACAGRARIPVISTAHHKSVFAIVFTSPVGRPAGDDVDRILKAVMVVLDKTSETQNQLANVCLPGPLFEETLREAGPYLKTQRERDFFVRASEDDRISMTFESKSDDYVCGVCPKCVAEKGQLN